MLVTQDPERTRAKLVSGRDCSSRNQFYFQQNHAEMVQTSNLIDLRLEGDLDERCHFADDLFLQSASHSYDIILAKLQASRGHLDGLRPEELFPHETLLKGRKTKYRALVTDIHLRDKMDGWDVARQAREIDPEFPVVYLSGKSAADWPSKGVPNSIMLEKPFAPTQLVTAVSNLLNSGTPTT
jgi:CheY-like chemotaxis protein